MKLDFRYPRGEEKELKEKEMIRKIDKRFKEMAYLNYAENKFSKKNHESYGFFRLLEDIDVMYSSFFTDLHMSYVDGLTDRIVDYQRVSDYVFNELNDYQVDNMILRNIESIRLYNKENTINELPNDYFERRREDAELWKNVYDQD